VLYGRAIGLHHVPGRDDATPEDLGRRSWKEHWPHYIRVRHSKFVAGSLKNGVSLNELMDTLKSDSFASTQRNAEDRTGNVDPRRAYRQKPGVELSPEGALWLDEKLTNALHRYGQIAESDVEALDWPQFDRTPADDLSANGARLLRVLVQAFRDPQFRIVDPRTFPTYAGTVQAMGVPPVRGPGLGGQFEREGGLDLNNWLRARNLPAITGLVIRSDTKCPGDNYFVSNGRAPTETQWWLGEIRRSATFDWLPYLRLP